MRVAAPTGAYENQDIWLNNRSQSPVALGVIGRALCQGGGRGGGGWAGTRELGSPRLTIVCCQVACTKELYVPSSMSVVSDR